MLRVALRIRAWLTACEHGVLPVLAGAAIAFAFAVWRWPSTIGPETYPEPIVGFNTWIARQSSGQTQLILSSVAIGAVGLLAIGAILRRASGGRDPERRAAVNSAFLLAMIPTLAWVAGASVRRGGSGVPLFPLAFLAVCLWFFICLGRHAARLKGDDLPRILSRTFLTVLFAGLSGLALTTMATHSRWIAPGTSEWLASAYAPLALATALVLGLALRLRASAEALEPLTARALLASQALLPLLALSVIPVPAWADGAPLAPMHRSTLTILVWSAVIAGMALWVRQWRHQSAQAGPWSWTQALCPFTLLFVAVFMCVPISAVPAMPPDHWHWGEMILPWQQWTRHGKVPFIDQIPIHGGLSLVRGMIGDWFFDGTSIGVTQADFLLFALAGAAAFLAAWAMGGPAPALMILLSGVVADRLLFFFPGMFLLCVPGLLRRPRAWLAVWVIVCVLVVAYNPSSGVALSLGTLLIAVVQAARATMAAPRSMAASAAAALALVVLLLAATPLGAVLRGFLQFIRDFNQYYALGGGVSIGGVFATPTTPDAPISSRFGYELFRMSWIIMIPLALGAGLVRVPRGATGRQTALLCLGVIYALAALFLTRWTLVRVEPTWSRIGLFAVAAIAHAAPLLFLTRTDWRRGPIIAAGLAALLTMGVQSPLLNSGVDPFVARAAAVPVVATGQKVVRGADHSLPALGTGIVAPDQLHAMQRLKEVTDRLLQPGETFLDLANEPAMYFYLDKPMPTPYSSPYYVPASHGQRSMLNAIAAHRPPIAIAGPARTHGEGPPWLRSFRYVRPLLLSMMPLEHSPWVILVDPSRLPSPVEPGSEAHLRLLDTIARQPDHLFNGSDLRLIPPVWGESWHAMAGQFDVVAALPPQAILRAASPTAVALDLGMATPGPITTRFDLRPLNLAGAKVDHLLFDCIFQTTQELPEIIIELDWRAEGQAPPKPIQFHFLPQRARHDPALPPGARRTTVLVPLGWDPRWLHARKLEYLRVYTTPVQPQISGFAVTPPTLLRLKDP